MGYLKERFGVVLAPTKPGTCPECGKVHEPGWPHDRDSLAYQYNFYDKHGRWPSWADAMEHCDNNTKAYWKTQLDAHGVDLNAQPETEVMSVEVKATGGRPPIAVTVKRRETHGH